MVPWGTDVQSRDEQLRGFIPSEPTFQSALAIVTARNSAFSWKLEGPKAKVANYQGILQGANYGRGWQHLMAQTCMDLYTQDKGAFIEVIRAENRPDSDLVALTHLDAARCFHTGLDETPVMYQDRVGRYHLLNWWQVISLAEMPAAIETLPGVQYCALTRVLRAARFMRDVAVYMSEKVGGRNVRAVTVIKGVTPKQIEDAWGAAQLKMDAVGFMRFSQPVMIGSVNPNADIGFETLEIAKLPDGFDLDLSQKQYILQLAMAFLTDYQEFAPLPGGGLGTSAQSQVLHQKSRGKGPGVWQKLIATALNFSVLPADLEFAWDEQDIEAEQAEGQARLTRAQARTSRITSGEITPKVAQMIAMDEGDLTLEQFEILQQQAEQQAEITASDAAPDEVNDASEHASPDEMVDDGSTAVSQTGGAASTNNGAQQVAKEAPLDPPPSRLKVEDSLASEIQTAFDELYGKLSAAAG